MEEWRGFDGRVEARGLRAEVSVLGAATGLRREDPLDLHLGAAPVESDLVGERRDRHDGAVGKSGQSCQLGARQEAVFVEERTLGCGYHLTFGRGQGRLGRRGRLGRLGRLRRLGRLGRLGRLRARRRRWRDGGTDSERRRGRHDAHGSGRVSPAGSRVVVE